MTKGQALALWLAIGFPVAGWLLLCREERTSKAQRVGLATFCIICVVLALAWLAVQPKY